jgi:glycerophosphoryl diester phosphodiesterase
MRIVAYRGGRGGGCEHSLLSMREAIAAGAQGLHLEVWPSRDGHPIVSRSDDLEETSDATGSIMAMTLEQTQGVQLADGSKLPTLVDVLREVHEDFRVQLFIELKHPKVALHTADLVDHYINMKGFGNHRIVLVSALHQLLVQVHHASPMLHLGVVMRQKTPALAACLDYTHSQYLLPEIDCLDGELMADAKAQDAFVLPWLCDAKEQREKAERLGCFGAMVSNPAMVKDA